MKDELKLEILRKLDTKSLIQKLHDYEDELQKALTDQADFVSKEHDYICTRGTDCQAVKSILAELLAQAPEVWEDTGGSLKAGKKLTVADRDAWLQTQRKENKELSDAIQRQRQTTFLQDDWQIKCEMAKRRLESTKIVLGLKTAQINFLASD